MNKFFSKIKNIFSAEELRLRLLNTLYYLMVFRLGSYIVLPGIDSSKLSSDIKGIFGLLNTFLGGAFSNASIFALGIMPYISASIIMHLFTIMIPYFQKINQEGDSGRNKLNQITKILTIFIAFFQSLGYLLTFIPNEIIIIKKSFFLSFSIIILVTGTIFCVWLGEKITDQGVGNGISLLIMTGIISSLPRALLSEIISLGIKGFLFFLVEIFFLFLIIMLITMFIQAKRKIPIKYPNQICQDNTYNEEKQNIPLKINSTGVMPIIFSQALMFIPSLLQKFFFKNNEYISSLLVSFSDFTTWQYNTLLSVLIIIFTFFYTSITMNPIEMANKIKKNKGFIPGIEPGRSTAEFIRKIINKIILPSSFFLVIVATLPSLAYFFGINKAFSRFYGGTSLLIIVSVLLEIIEKVKSYLLADQYNNIENIDKL